MAVVLQEGFDYFNNTVLGISKLYVGSASGASYYTIEAGRYGGKSFYMVIGVSLGLPLPSALSTLSVGASVQAHQASGSGASIMQFDDDTQTGICQLWCKADGTLVFTRGTSATANILATSASGAMPSAAGTWHHIGVELVRHATAGSVKVYVDGVLVMSATGVNTGANNIRYVYIYGNGTYWDDVYVTDTVPWLGEQRITTLVPDGDTAQADSTPLSGSDRYAMVDEASCDGDVSYTVLAAAGDKDRYTMGDLAYNPVGISSIKTVLVARKDDASTRTIRTNLKSGGTTVNGATKGLSSSYQIIQDIYQSDPNSGDNWTQTSVNAIEVGAEVVA